MSILARQTNTDGPLGKTKPSFSLQEADLREFSRPKNDNYVLLPRSDTRVFMGFYDFLIRKGHSEEEARQRAAEFQEYEAEIFKAVSKARGAAAPGPILTTDAPPLPTKAPALWAEDREAGETPPTFIQRHYEPWLGKGLGRADIRRLDPKLYQALATWLQRNKLPDGMMLPTLKERNDKWVEQMRSGTMSLAGPDAPGSVQQLERLSWVARKRNSSTHR